jgi:NAD(P)-dependent dehydrogenase (short-subunit alcohol dehydrogenase family)
MRNFTQKQNQPQKHASCSLARSNTGSNTVAPGPRRADLILHLHRTIGNQAAGDIERESVRRLAMRRWKRGCSFNFPVLL